MRFLGLSLIWVTAVAAFASTPERPTPDHPKSVSVRGILTQRSGKPPALETADHKLISLDGDAATRAVLNDKRLAGFDLEARGHFVAADKFLIDAIYKKAMFVHKDGHLKVITYWCDTCSIRTYEPGRCVCCQQETTLDLRDPDQEN